MENGNGHALSNANIIEHDDGFTIMFLEGLRSRQEAASVSREIENAIQRAVVKGGKQHLVMAIPPPVRLVVVRGKRVEMQRTADNRIRMEVAANRAGQGLLLPGRDFKIQ